MRVIGKSSCSLGRRRTEIASRAATIGASRAIANKGFYLYARRKRLSTLPASTRTMHRGKRHGACILRDLLDIMWQRHTCRTAYDPAVQVRGQDLQRILDAARWAP